MRLTIAMYIGNAQDEQNEAVQAAASGRQFFFVMNIHLDH